MFLLRKFFVGLLTLSLACAPVSAQVAQTGGGLAVSGVNLTETDNACLAVSGTTQQFTAKKFGGGAPSRIIIVSINWSDSTLAGTAEITGVTIDGNAATRAVRAAGDNQNSNAEIWYASIPSGTVGNIDVVSSTAVDGMTIGVYRLVNFFFPTPVSSAIGTTTATASNLAAGYATLATASRRTNVSTSLSNITNNYSTACGATLWGVHASNLATGSGSIATTISPTTSTPLIAMAVWAPGATTTTWNPSDKSGNCTLSNGNLTATCGTAGGSYSMVRAVAGKTLGKFYFEITETGAAAGNEVVGIANASAGLTLYVGFNNNSSGMDGTGNIIRNSASVGTGTNVASGDIISIAVDRDNNAFWFRVNGGIWNNNAANDPATNTGGVAISAVTGTIFPAANGYLSTDTFTANFGASAFTYAVPSGFIAGWPAN